MSKALSVIHQWMLNYKAASGNPDGTMPIDPPGPRGFGTGADDTPTVVTRSPEERKDDRMENINILINEEHDFDESPGDTLFDSEVDLRYPSANDVIRYFMFGHYKRDRYKAHNDEMLLRLFEIQPSKFFDRMLFNDPGFVDDTRRAVFHVAVLEPEYFKKFVEPNFPELSEGYRSLADRSMADGRDDAQRRDELLQQKLSHRKTAKEKYTAWVYIKLPDFLSKQFPLLSGHDNSDPHITALYIGAADPKNADKLVKTVKSVVRDFSPFEIALDEKVSYFPATKHSDGCKVAKLNAVSDELHRLHKELKSALADADIPIDDHFPSYKPHVTLSYMDPPRKTYDRQLPEGSWVVSDIYVGCGDKDTKIVLGPTKTSALSARAGKLDYPQGMLDDIMKWVLEESPKFKWKLFGKSDDKLSRLFSIDITDTAQYKTHEWMPEAAAEAEKYGWDSELLVTMYKSSPYDGTGGRQTGGAYSHDSSGTKPHEIWIFDTLGEIKSGELEDTIKHELTHMMQQVMTTLVEIRNERGLKHKPVGMPAGHEPENPLSHRTEGLGDWNKTLMEYRRRDIEFAPFLQEAISRMQKYIGDSTGDESKKRLGDFIAGDKFLGGLRGFDTTRYNKALREIYRAYETQSNQTQ